MLSNKQPQRQLASMADDLDVGQQPKQCQELHQRRVVHHVLQAAQRVQDHTNYLVVEVINSFFPLVYNAALSSNAYRKQMLTFSRSYSGSALRANVAYDTFVGTSCTGAQAYEVMVWLGDFGGVSPLSNNGYPPTPTATPTIGNTAFNLIVGTNGATAVYSFVAQKNATSYSGDLLAFYKYLETNEGLPSSDYLQTIQAGSEVFTGSGAELLTTAYTISSS